MSNSLDYGELHKWAQGQRPVFIVGPERSGTSMMFRSVVSHPSFCSFSNATVETFCFIRPQQLLEPPSPRNYEMRVYLGTQYQSFTSAVEPIRQINKVCDQSALAKNYLGNQRRQIWDRRGYRDLLRAFFYFSWKNLGEKRIAEKTPAHIRCIQEIFETFPGAKVLICLRNPVEIVASHRKRLAREIELGKDKDDPGLDWLRKSVNDFVRYFKSIDHLINVAKRLHPSGIKIVPYDRVTTSVVFLREIFMFLGEDPGEIATGGQHSVIDRALSWDPLLASLPRENTIDWARWISTEDAKLIQSASETILKEWHSELSYD